MASPEHQGSFSPPTKSQIAASRVGEFLKITTEAKRHAKEHAETNPFHIRKRLEEKKTLKDQYTAAKLVRREVPFSQDASAAEITRGQRTKILIKAARAAAGLTQKQRVKLFEAAGYPHDEAKTIGRKIWISFGVSIAAGSVSNITTAAAITHETVAPTIEYHHITDPKTALAVGLSYLMQYGAIYINAKTNKALLHRTGFNPNILSTAGYHLGDKLLVSDKAKDRGSDLGSFGVAVGLEPFVLGSTIATPFIAVGRNVGGALYNLASAGVNTGLLLTNHYLEKRRRKKTSGDIFVAPKKQ